MPHQRHSQTSVNGNWWIKIPQARVDKFYIKPHWNFTSELPLWMFVKLSHNYLQRIYLLSPLKLQTRSNERMQWSSKAFITEMYFNMNIQLFLFRILWEGSSINCSAPFIHEARINPVWCLSLKSTCTKWMSANLSEDCFPGENNHQKISEEGEITSQLHQLYF